jgi:excisionase family DNA binding protein
MTPPNSKPPPEQLLTVAQVAELLGTTERFPRRLIAERRIRFVRVGRHVRIPESALAEFVASGMSATLECGAVATGQVLVNVATLADFRRLAARRTVRLELGRQGCAGAGC